MFKTTQYSTPLKKTVKHNLATMIWLTICCVGLCIQGNKIWSGYFSYAINTNVQLTIQENLKVPTMVFCSELVRLIKWHELSHEERVLVLHSDSGQSLVNYDAKNETHESIKRLPLIVKNSTWKAINKIAIRLQGLSIDRLLQLTYDYNDVFYWIRSYVENASDVNQSYQIFMPSDYDKIFTLRQFVFDFYKCFIFERKGDFKDIKYSHVKRQTKTPGLVYQIMLSQSFCEKLLYTCLSLTQTTLTVDEAFVPLNVEPRVHILKYETFERKLLPKPFMTKCVTYTDIGFDSRGKCYEHCLLKAVELETNGTKVPPSVGIYSNTRKKIIGMSELDKRTLMAHKNETYEQMLHRVDSSCEDKCQEKDCESVTHVPSIMGSFEASNTVYNMYLPISPTISATCQEAVSLIEFLTDMVSAFGFWFGLSVFGLWDFIISLVGRYTRSQVQKFSHIKRNRTQFTTSSNLVTQKRWAMKRRLAGRHSSISGNIPELPRFSA